MSNEYVQVATVASIPLDAAVERMRDNSSNYILISLPLKPEEDLMFMTYTSVPEGAARGIIASAAELIHQVLTSPQTSHLEIPDAEV